MNAIELRELRELAEKVMSGKCKALDVVDYRDRTMPAKVIELLDTIEAQANELADALDCKNGKGPTALGMVIAERDALRAQLEAQAKQIEALQADAERYRWLRMNPEWLGWDSDFQPDEIEREIDAARKGNV